MGCQAFIIIQVCKYHETLKYKYLDANHMFYNTIVKHFMLTVVYFAVKDKPYLHVVT